MRIRVNSHNGEIIITGAGELAMKLSREFARGHTPEFMQQYMRNEVIAALKKEAETA